MTTEEKLIRDGNQLIAYFLGDKDYLFGYILDYHGNWNTLMKACHAWDNLDTKLVTNKLTYELASDLLDEIVTRYEIQPAWERLVDNLIWYFK